MTSSDNRIRFGFDHQHSGFGSGNDQIHLGGLELRCGRIDDVLTINVANACRADRAIEGDTGDGQRSRGADHGGDVGIDFRIDRTARG